MPSPRLFPRLLLVLTLAVSTQGLLLVQGTFLLRQDYVASMLCVNRFNPESDCNGKCYLKQQMEHHMGGHHSHDGHEQAPALLEVALTFHALVVDIGEAEADFYSRGSSSAPLDERHVPRLVVSGVFHPPRIG